MLDQGFNVSRDRGIALKASFPVELHEGAVRRELDLFISVIRGIRIRKNRGVFAIGPDSAPVRLDLKVCNSGNERICAKVSEQAGHGNPNGIRALTNLEGTLIESNVIILTGAIKSHLQKKASPLNQLISRQEN